MNEVPLHTDSSPSGNWRRLLVRRECWRLTWRARALVVLLLLAFLFTFVHGIHGFLAVRQPLPAEVLVVEGWVPPYTLREVAADFQNHHYRRVVVVRPVYDDLDKYESGRFAAAYLTNTLVLDGIPGDRMDLIFCSVAQKDRTYHSALAAKQHLADLRLQPGAINLVTLGPHARRSRLLYQKAFGEAVQIGIIALENREYDSSHWWRYSEGVREILGESIAYFYARLFFHPSATESPVPLAPTAPQP